MEARKEPPCFTYVLPIFVKTLILLGFQGCSGDPDRIRTCDLLIRSQLLYPAELRDPKQGTKLIDSSRIESHHQNAIHSRSHHDLPFMIGQ